jgi:signal peptidase I
MQCVNCQFENMPGSAHCARCGTSLRLASLAISIEPPRATAWQKRLRRLVPWQLRWRAYQSASVTRRDLDVELPGAGLALRLLIPGWPQWYRGQARRGALLLAGYLASVLLGLATWGSILGSTCWGLAVGLHALSCFDALVVDQRMGNRRGRMLAGVLVAVLVFAVYYQGVRMVSLPWEPMRLLSASGPLRPGDVVLIHRWAYRDVPPRVGDVVLYDAPGGLLAPRRNRVLRFVGWRIDRIVAGPGDTIRWENGQLFVNGAASKVQPLNMRAMPPRFQATVPEGRFAILPTTDPRFEQFVAGINLQAPNLATQNLQATIMVPRGDIEGRAIVRHYPPWRFWWIR